MRYAPHLSIKSTWFTLAKTKVYIKRIDPRPWYTTYWPHPLWELPPMFSEITDFPFFEKIHFFHFLEPKKSSFFHFEGPPQCFLATKPWLAYQLMINLNAQNPKVISLMKANVAACTTGVSMGGPQGSTVGRGSSGTWTVDSVTGRRRSGATCDVADIFFITCDMVTIITCLVIRTCDIDMG